MDDETVEEIGITDAKKNLYNRLELVRLGRVIVVSKRGIPMAAMVPVNRRGGPDEEALGRWRGAYEERAWHEEH